MTATYTFDIFSTLDGFANHNGDWGGYWGKQGPEFLAHRAAAYRDPLRMVLQIDWAAPASERASRWKHRTVMFKVSLQQ